MKYHAPIAKISAKISFVKCFDTILDIAIGFITKTYTFQV